MKKLLALVLALVMSMSLVTISNAAFKDADSIDYKEAVDVMNAVGVFIGDEKGNFNAKENLTREQAAKIIAYLELGEKAADALVGSATFTDVAATRWSAGFVSYCAQAGVVSGYDGKFDPAGQLTALQFGKMLLVEIGYDAKAAGMVGTDWAINTSKLLATTGLMNGIDGSVNQVLTREKAAQMCLNALKTPTVEYATKGSNITVNGAEINFGASVPTYVTNTVAKEQTISNDTLTNSKEYTIELGEKLFKKLVLENDTTDAFGRPTHTWKLATTKIGEYADEATLTYTKKVELGDIYADLGLSKSTKVNELYIDGKEATLPTLVKKSEAKLEGSANGVLTQVYYDEDANKGEGEIIITEIGTYVATVQSVTKASSTADRSIKLEVKGDSRPGTMDYKYETEDFAKDDLVTYTAAYNDSAKKYEIQSVALLKESTTGLLTQWKGSAVIDADKGTSNSNFTVDGTVYEYSSHNVIADADGKKLDKGIASFDVNESKINVYLDAYGYAIYVTGVEGTKYYAAVIGIGKSNQYGSETKGVTLLLPDGTTKEVKAKLASGYDWKNNFQATNGTDVAKWQSATGFENLVTDGVADIVTYTEDDGIYKLTPVANYAKNTVAGTGSVNSFLNGKSVMKLKLDNSTEHVYYTTSETVFMVATPKSNSTSYNYNVYVGYENAPGFPVDKDINGVAIVEDENHQVEVVYIDAARMAGISGVDTYFVKSDSAKIITDSTGKYYILPAIVDGEETTIKVDAGADVTCVGGSTMNAAKFEDATGLFAIDNVKKNSKGIITDFDLQNKGTFGAAYGYVGTVEAGKVVLGIGKVSVSANVNALKAGATYWAYNDKTAVYVVDKDYKTITVSSVANVITDLNDLVYASYTTENGNKKLTDVIIIEQDDNAVNPNLPVVNAYDYEVDYSTPSAVKVNYYTGLAHDTNTLIDVILSVMTDDGYTNFKVSETSGTYTIEATKGYVTMTYSFKNDSSSVTECVKISLNGKSMLAKKESSTGVAAKLDAAGVTLNGTYAEGVKKDGTPIARDVVANIEVLDGAAYETFYKATIQIDSTQSNYGSVTAGNTSYVKAGETKDVEVKVNISSLASGDKRVFTATSADAAKLTAKAPTTAVALNDSKVATFTVTITGVTGDATVNITWAYA